jgi:hypothetical protein
MSDTPRVEEAHLHEHLELDDKFESLCCQICGNICDNACLCQDCQLPYCQGCLGESEECSCGANFEDNTINISTFFEAVLQDVDVECGFEDCHFKAKYHDVLDHIVECPLRDYTCPECEEEMQHIDAKSHTARCAESLVTCPNKCKSTAFARKELADHQKVCKRRPVSCRFAKNGCEFEGDFKSYMHHLVDCAFDAPVDHKRKVDEVDEESEEEAKPLKKRKIIPEEDETVISEDKIETVEQVTEPAEPSKIMEVLLQNAPMVVEEAVELDEEEERGDAPEPDDNASSEESESEDEKETAEENPVAQTPEDSEDAEGQEAIPNSPERASEKVEDAIVAPSAGIFSKIRKIVSSMSSGNLETLESVEQAM